MSLLTAPCDGAAGSATPPDPCTPSGAAMSDALITVADHRAQCLIPTFVERRSSLACTERKPYVHVPTGSRLIIASRYHLATHANRPRGDDHRPHIRAVPDVVEAHKRPQPYSPYRPVPPPPNLGAPPAFAHPPTPV